MYQKQWILSNLITQNIINMKTKYRILHKKNKYFVQIKTFIFWHQAYVPKYSEYFWNSRPYVALLDWTYHLKEKFNDHDMLVEDYNPDKAAFENLSEAKDFINMMKKLSSFTYRGHKVVEVKPNVFVDESREVYYTHILDESCFNIWDNDVNKLKDKIDYYEKRKKSNKIKEVIEIINV